MLGAACTRAQWPARPPFPDLWALALGALAGRSVATGSQVGVCDLPQEDSYARTISNATPSPGEGAAGPTTPGSREETFGR